MMKRLFDSMVLLSSAAVAACSSDTSSSGTGAGGQTNASSAAHSSSSGTGGGSSTSSAGGAGGGMDCSKQPAAMCQGCCADSEPDAYTKFKGYHLQDCACTDALAPCHMACTTGTDVCANPMSPTDACTTCLVAEGAKGAGSMCTFESAQTCQGDAACAPFIKCALGCPAP